MSNSSQRFSDAVGVANTNTPSLLEEPRFAPILVFPGEYGTILHVQPHHRCSFTVVNVCCTDTSPKKGGGGERIIQYDELSIGREIGRGGFGVVYQGTWRLTDVAIKKLLLEHLTDEARKEFEAEAQTMKELRHPNIVQFLGYCICLLYTSPSPRD